MYLDGTAPIVDARTSSSRVGIQASSSSRATLSTGTSIIPLIHILKLENQMSILLHLLNHLMRKLIAESEERSKKRFEETIDHNVEAVH